MEEQKIDNDASSDEGDGSRLLHDLLSTAAFPPTPPPSPRTAGFRCPICYTTRARPCALECGHLFCVPCAETALLAARACPLCRRRPNRIAVREVFVENAGEDGSSDAPSDEPSLTGVHMGLRGCGVHVFAALLRAFTLQSAPRQIVRSLFTVVVVYSHYGDHTYLQFLNSSGSTDNQLHAILGQKLPRFSPADPPDSLLSSSSSMQYGVLASEIIDTYGAFVTRWMVLDVLEYMLEASGFDEHERRVANFIDGDARLRDIPQNRDFE